MPEPLPNLLTGNIPRVLTATRGIRSLPAGAASIRFSAPQKGVAPGQAAIFYEGTRFSALLDRWRGVKAAPRRSGSPISSEVIVPEPRDENFPEK
jgi:hypothetical protein